MVKRKLNIEIDEVVLDGFSPFEGEQVSVAFKQELSRLAAECGLASGSEATDNTANIDALSIGVSSNQNPHVLGKEIAKSIYGGLNRRAKP